MPSLSRSWQRCRPRNRSRADLRLCRMPGPSKECERSKRGAGLMKWFFLSLALAVLGVLVVSVLAAPPAGGMDGRGLLALGVGGLGLGVLLRDEVKA